MNEMYPVYKGMLDPIKISYKLTIYLCVTYLDYNKYPVNTTYNNCAWKKTKFEIIV